MNWSQSVDSLLDKIRLNCIQLTNRHIKNHLYYKGASAYFEIPTIILSVFSGSFSVGSDVLLHQELISIITCSISMVITILTSIKLYMKITENSSQEQELAISFKSLALDIFKMLSFVTSTYMGVSMPIDEFELPDFIKEKKEELDKINDPEEYTEKYKEIADELHIYMKKHNMQISDLVESGSGKGWDQPDQLLLAKGAVANPQGDVYLSKNSLSKGFNSVEFFYGGGASRKGIIDRVLNTASTGYLTRQLVYALGSVMLSENIDDCNTNEYLTFYLNKEIAERITGRWIKTENMNSWMQINSIKELDDDFDNYVKNVLVN